MHNLKNNQSQKCHFTVTSPLNSLGAEGRVGSSLRVIELLRAFNQVRAGGSLNPDVYTEGGEALKRASLLSTSPLGKREKEPHGVFGVGLSSFEYYLHHLSGVSW